MTMERGCSARYWFELRRGLKQVRYRRRWPHIIHLKDLDDTQSTGVREAVSLALVGELSPKTRGVRFGMGTVRVESAAAAGRSTKTGIDLLGVAKGDRERACVAIQDRS